MFGLVSSVPNQTDRPRCSVTTRLLSTWDHIPSFVMIAVGPFCWHKYQRNGQWANISRLWSGVWQPIRFTLVRTNPCASRYYTNLCDCKCTIHDPTKFAMCKSSKLCSSLKANLMKVIFFLSYGLRQLLSATKIDELSEITFPPGKFRVTQTRWHDSRKFLSTGSCTRNVNTDLHAYSFSVRMQNGVVLFDRPRKYGGNFRSITTERSIYRTRCSRNLSGPRFFR